MRLLQYWTVLGEALLAPAPCNRPAPEPDGQRIRAPSPTNPSQSLMRLTFHLDGAHLEQLSAMTFAYTP
jgi:hypothetical protein